MGFFPSQACLNCSCYGLFPQPGLPVGFLQSRKDIGQSRARGRFPHHPGPVPPKILEPGSWYQDLGTRILVNYPSVTLTRVFSSLGLEFLGVFNLASVVYHLRPGQLVSDFRFHISDFRFQIPDFRFQISDFRFQISVFRFRISDFRFQIPDFRFQISDFRF